MEGIDKLVDRIKANAFDLDAEGNLAKLNDLLEIKVKLEKRLFELHIRFDLEKNKLLLKEEIQKGKNAETRTALMELELAGTDYDKIAEFKFLLGIIGSVQRHNDIVLDLFFRESKHGE